VAPDDRETCLTTDERLDAAAEVLAGFWLARTRSVRLRRGEAPEAVFAEPVRNE
jgi:hypothetical protein